MSLTKKVLLILLQSSFMSTIKNGNYTIVGNDFSWIEENKKDLAHLEELDANVQIALRLRKCMKERGWSQKDLAAALGVSPQYVNKVLRNQEPTFSVKVADEYGKKLHYPLIKVCNEKDERNDVFSARAIYYTQQIFPSVDFWEIDTAKKNVFCFIPKGMTLNKRKSRLKQVTSLSYA